MTTFRDAGQLQRKLSRSPIAKILLGSAGGQGILLAASPLLTRLYSPTDFGALAVLTALAAVLGVVATLRWEAGIVLPAQDKDARALGWLALGSAVLVSSLTALFLLVWPGSIEIFAENSASPIFWWLLPVTLFSIGLHKVLSAWMIRMEQFARLGQRNFLVGIGQLAVQLGLGLAGVKPIGLLLGLAGGRLAGTGGAFGKEGLFYGGPPQVSVVRRVASRYRRFPLISAFSATLNSLGLQAPVLLLSAFYGGVGFGLLALTMRVITAPVGIVSDAVSQHFESAAAKAIRSGEQNLMVLLRRTILRQLIVGAFPVLILIAAGPWLFATIFGQEWQDSGVFAQVLAVGYYCQFIVSPVSKTLLLLELHGLQAAWDLARTMSMVAALGACGLFKADLMLACIVMAAIQVTGYGLLLASIIRAARRGPRRRPRHSARYPV